MLQLLAHGHSAVHTVTAVVIAHAGDQHKVTGHQGVGHHYIAGRRGIDQNIVIFAGNLCQAHGQKHIDTGAFGLFQDLQLLGRHWGVAICRNYINIIKLRAGNIVLRAADAIGTEHIIHASAVKSIIGYTCARQGIGTVALGIHIHNKHPLAVLRHQRRQVADGNGFSHAAFFNAD